MLLDAHRKRVVLTVSPEAVPVLARHLRHIGLKGLRYLGVMRHGFYHTFGALIVQYRFEQFHVTLLLLGYSESFEEFLIMIKQHLPYPSLLVVTTHDLPTDRFPSVLADTPVLPEELVFSDFAPNVNLSEFAPEWSP